MSAATNGLPPIPDFLGTAARVERVATLLQNGQDQLGGLRGMMLANGHQTSDLIPSSDKDDETYAARIERLEGGMAALMADSEDIREELIAEAVRRRKAVETEIEKRHAEPSVG